MKKIEYGKYSFFEEGKKFTEIDKMLLLQASVNEMAETNRLKRLELQALDIINNIPDIRGQYEIDMAGHQEGWKEWNKEKEEVKNGL